MAYNTTKVSIHQSQAEISRLLEKNGIEGVCFSQIFGKMVTVQFGYHTPDSSRVIRYDVNVKEVSKKDGNGNPKTDERLRKDRDQAQRGALRMLYWYLKTAFEAVESGLIKRDDVFMPFFVLGDGRLLKDKILSDTGERGEGRLLLAEFAE